MQNKQMSMGQRKKNMWKVETTTISGTAVEYNSSTINIINTL